MSEVRERSFSSSPPDRVVGVELSPPSSSNSYRRHRLTRNNNNNNNNGTNLHHQHFQHQPYDYDGDSELEGEKGHYYSPRRRSVSSRLKTLCASCSAPGLLRRYFRGASLATQILSISLLALSVLLLFRIFYLFLTFVTTRLYPAIRYRYYHPSHFRSPLLVPEGWEGYRLGDIFKGRHVLRVGGRGGGGRLEEGWREGVRGLEEPGLGPFTRTHFPGSIAVRYMDRAREKGVVFPGDDGSDRVGGVDEEERMKIFNEVVDEYIHKKCEEGRRKRMKTDLGAKKGIGDGSSAVGGRLVDSEGGIEAAVVGCGDGEEEKKRTRTLSTDLMAQSLGLDPAWHPPSPDTLVVHLRVGDVIEWENRPIEVMLRGETVSFGREREEEEEEEEDGKNTPGHGNGRREGEERERVKTSITCQEDAETNDINQNNNNNNNNIKNNKFNNPSLSTVVAFDGHREGATFALLPTIRYTTPLHTIARGIQQLQHLSEKEKGKEKEKVGTDDASSSSSSISSGPTKSFPLPIRRVVLVAAAHEPNGSWDGAMEKSLAYVLAVANYFSTFGLPVEMRLGQTPDEDVAFLSRARYFCRGGGGFSRLMARLVKSRGGTVVCTH